MIKAMKEQHNDLELEQLTSKSDLKVTQMIWEEIGLEQLKSEVVGESEYLKRQMTKLRREFKIFL